MFSCDICGIHFTENRSLTRHKESKHAGVKYSCDKCDYRTTGNLKVHQQAVHDGIQL